MRSGEDRYEWARFLVAKLERLSADSLWAHRASGLRGALLRAMAINEREAAMPHDPADDQEATALDRLIAEAFDILEKAAKEIPDPQRGHKP